MALRTSEAGRAAITAREGCRLSAYRDSVNVVTIGIGHSDRAPSGVKPVMGMCITAAEADSILADDLVAFEAAVNGATKRPMTQNQFNACVSLAFNIGIGGFTGSTVVHRFNAGDVMGAADAFLMWEKPHELAQRRIGERAQFLAKDDSTVVSHPITPIQVVSHNPTSVIDKPKALDGKSIFPTFKVDVPMPAGTAVPKDYIAPAVTDVRWLQETLSDLGYYRGPVDADFGPYTETAVKGFQLAHGLAVDGVVGDATMAAIDAAMVVRAAAPPVPSPGLGRIPEAPGILRSSPSTVAHFGPTAPYTPPAVPGPHLGITAATKQSWIQWWTGLFGKA